MPPKEKYTDPELREQVKEEVKESDKGGAPGQWSARKAQMMASEYKKRGGGYNQSKEQGQDESQKNLEKWGEEEWQTKEGSGHAKKSDGSRQRYLPKKAWEEMDDDEMEETEQKKREGGKEGKQFVENTGKAKDSRKKANAEENEQFEARHQAQKSHKNKNNNDNSKSQTSKRAEKEATDKQAEVEEEGSTQNDDSSEDELTQANAGGDPEADFVPEDDDNANEGGKETSNSGKEDSGYDSEERTSSSRASPGKKRGRDTKDSGKDQGKKQKSNNGKTMGSKHDSTEEPAQQGSSQRMPDKGQRVSWRAMPGWVHGVLERIITSNSTIDGKSVKASKEDPRFVLKADSGKICVHKPETCYYD